MQNVTLKICFFFYTYVFISALVASFKMGHGYQGMYKINVQLNRGYYHAVLKIHQMMSGCTRKTTSYNTTLLPSVNTLIARGMLCGAKYTHHTFTPIIKKLITTTANKHPGKNSFIDKNIKNPTGIKLFISHKIATSPRTLS